MATMDKEALRHVEEYHRYERSSQSTLDRAIDRQRRERADRACGHLPTCTLSRCAPDCPRNAAEPCKDP
jgi:hypothetical protein